MAHDNLTVNIQAISPIRERVSLSLADNWQRHCNRHLISDLSPEHAKTIEANTFLLQVVAKFKAPHEMHECNIE